MPTLNRDQALFFRGEFRAARARALKDAEAYHELLYALERLGGFLRGKQGDLNKYEEAISDLASRSPLACEIPANWRALHIPFRLLYRLVRKGRNHAMHQGAFARHLTVHAVSLSLILETAMESYLQPVIADYMVRGPVTADLWQPMSFVRQMMLLNSYSFLPILYGRGSDKEWKLLADVSVAQYLRGTDAEDLSSSRLAKTVADAIEAGLELLSPRILQPQDSISVALDHGESRPILVLDDAKHLVGLVTPFDLL